MAYAIAILRNRRSLQEMQPHVEAHRADVRQLHEQGTVIAGGPLEPRYVVAGVAQYETLIWNPIIGGLDQQSSCTNSAITPTDS
jgi:uncharacterized protein YciI